MGSPHRCKCDECKSAEMVLQELDYAIPARFVPREIMSAAVE